MNRRRSSLLLGFVLLGAAWPVAAAESTVRLTRVPRHGVQPKAVLDHKGTLHLVYLAGDPGGSDVFYTRRRANETGFAKPLRVNQTPGSAVAVGTIRGARLALGQMGRVHVAWNGSHKAGEKGHGAPMFYTRLIEDGGGFEPERNLMTRTRTLDGGGAVVADANGNVQVVWHAAPLGAAHGENARGVYVAKSSDHGKTFAREVGINPLPGTCGCCGLDAFLDRDGRLLTLYRGVRDAQRDMMLLVGNRPAAAKSLVVGPWTVRTCPMSAAAFAQAPGGIAGAWEAKGDIHLGWFGTGGASVKNSTLIHRQAHQRHPSIAANTNGTMLVAWSENTGWKKGGDLAWRIYDAKAKPTGQPGQRLRGVPKWSFAAAVAHPDGSFEILH
ncbi:MAG: hypothetical protein H8E20_04825 [Verrucomicrobia bacterium]|nr:hypothetical protein [Verrucomicrobiota bacterium]